MLNEGRARGVWCDQTCEKKDEDTIDSHPCLQSTAILKANCVMLIGGEGMAVGMYASLHMTATAFVVNKLLLMVTESRTH